ncbi:Flp pilus assembly protein CpaB [Paracandidimonas soli]|uniref:Pilus assembly protein CpaB n=1 Tax=Paracandidimonas soli TaxID=1917182 RepID=A0A4R3VAL7_9BURK|nr:Flp pilus assembly protein CpaB [Paracandidimonas soli]TCV00624.1 pilus assembly protein CpaB [Paracandidimonas soli]
MSSMSKIVAGVLVLLAIVLGVFAARLALKEPEPAPVVAQREVRPEPVVETKERTLYPVVVAARDLEPGVPLRAEDLQMDGWPAAPAQGFAQADPLVGEKLREALRKGEPLTERLLAQGLSRHLQAGERAIMVAVDESLGGAGGIAPGDRVDVFFTLGRDNENQNTQARLLLPSARVLAFGQDSLDGPVGAEAQKGRTSVAARSAMLAVPLAEVNGLLLAMGKGKLQLALRSPEDKAQPDAALFAEREPVLQARAGLSPDERERLRQAENLAYAGDSIASLAASEPAVPESQAGQAAPGKKGDAARSVQVIRGRQSGLHHY